MGAAHIKAYRGEQDNHPDNGLLLRSDIHTLFDVDLHGIEPEHLQVENHPGIAIELPGLFKFGKGNGRVTTHLVLNELDIARP